MELLKELHAEGSTILMVTHDPRYSAYAERTIHLFDGRVVEENHRANPAGDRSVSLTEAAV
jgi:putative ABC transport system ATP-binding protein